MNVFLPAAALSFLLSASACAFTVRFASTAPMDGKVKGPDGVAVEAFTCQVASGGTTPVVTASPTGGCRLVGWKGDFSSKELSICVANVTRDMNIQADFCALNKWRVAFASTAGGHVEGTVIQYVDNLGSCSSVIASPDDGFDFSGWTGGVTTSANPLSVEYVSSDLDVTANFTNTVYRVVTFTAAAGGSLLGETTQSVRNNGATTAVEAVPDEGFEFDKWTGDIETADNPLAIYAVVRNISVVAVFKEAGGGAKEDYSVFKAVSITLNCNPNALKIKTVVNSTSAPGAPVALDGANLSISKKSASSGTYKFEMTAVPADNAPVMPLAGSTLVMSVGGTLYKSVDAISKENCSWKGVSGNMSLSAKRNVSGSNAKLQVDLSGAGSGPVAAYELRFSGVDPFKMSECRYSTSGSKWKVKIICSDIRARTFPAASVLDLLVTNKDGTSANYSFSNSVTRTATAVRK